MSLKLELPFRNQFIWRCVWSLPKCVWNGKFTTVPTDRPLPPRMYDVGFVLRNEKAMLTGIFCSTIHGWSRWSGTPSLVPRQATALRETRNSDIYPYFTYFVYILLCSITWTVASETASKCTLREFGILVGRALAAQRKYEYFPIFVSFFTFQTLIFRDLHLPTVSFRSVSTTIPFNKNVFALSARRRKCIRDG